MLIFFGTSGDLAYLTDQQGFRTEAIAQERPEKDDWRVQYFTFRLTQHSRQRGIRLVA